ncbi:MAG: folate-binding protein [Dokdonella sp.]
MSDGFNLGSAGLVRLQGPDSRSFAQSQFCSDVAALAANDWQWSAWLDAKGRVRYFFALMDAGDDGLLAWLPLGDAVAFALELRRFQFRAKLTIESVEGFSVLGQFDAALDSPRWQRDGDIVQLRLDGATPRLVSLAPRPPSQVDPAAVQRWRGFDASDGLPLIDAACATEFVPQSLDLERLGGVSFGKGCYPGQEIAARLHFRGGNKRGLRVIGWDAASASAIPGARLSGIDTENTLGTLLYSGVAAGRPIGLAVLADPQSSAQITLPDGTQASCLAS